MRHPTLTRILWLLLPVAFVAVPPALADPHLLAHRGLCQHAPENTLPAYAAAVDLGLDIETDVYQTKDNHLVLIHDKTLDRTTDGTGPVIEKTLAELRKLDAGTWFNPVYAGLKIPTLDELLKLVKKTEWRRTVIAVNMKTISPGIEKRICDTLREHGMTDRCFVFAMNKASAKRFRDADPALARAISVRKFADFDKAVADPDYQCIWYYDTPTRAQIETAHKADKRVWLSGNCIKNDPDCWENAKRTGADGLCTDHPLEARKLWSDILEQEPRSGLPVHGTWIETPTGTPVIDRGSPGSWDHYAVDNPFLFRHLDIYYCFYEGQDKPFEQGGHERIGMATSSDTIHWSKHPSNPILDVGSDGAWDEIVAKLPNVFQHKDTFYLFYSGRNEAVKQIGLATSKDLKTWTKHPANPILTGRANDWDAHLSTHPAPVVQRAGKFNLLYRGMKSLYHHQNLGLAISGDLIHWTRVANNPLLPPNVECYSLAVAQVDAAWFAIMQSPDRRTWHSTDLLRWTAGPKPIFSSPNVDTISNPIPLDQSWIILYEQKDRIHRAVYHEKRKHH